MPKIGAPIWVLTPPIAGNFLLSGNILLSVKGIAVICCLSNVLFLNRLSSFLFLSLSSLSRPVCCWDGPTLTQCPVISVPQRHWPDPHTLPYLLWVLPCFRWVGPLELNGAFIPISEELIGMKSFISPPNVCPRYWGHNNQQYTAILSCGELTLRHTPPSKVIQRYNSISGQSPPDPSLETCSKKPFGKFLAFQRRLLYRWNEPSSGDFFSYSLSF